jgi:hypothetical protein
MTCDGGAAGYVDVVAQLLTATFGSAAPASETPTPVVPVTSRQTEDRPVLRPFPGTK